MGKFAHRLSSTEAMLRVTVSALMRACDENQTSLAKSIGITQGQLSRKQTGGAAYSFGDLDKLSAHYGIPVPDLVAGPSHALSKLSPVRLAQTVGGRQEVITV
ncbi:MULTISPECIES: helix-turn-helix domain-containing protein [Bacteria]|uniref:Acyltransferase n=1 Tax=Streptomyces sindenensis TaxID=67363 RepID=A0ABW6ERC1_9ACTN